MTVKTVIIWDLCGDEQIQFVTLDGDLRKYNNIYLNMDSEDTHEMQMQEELNTLLYDEETGDYRVVFESVFPTNDVKEGAYVIVCGMLP